LNAELNESRLLIDDLNNEIEEMTASMIGQHQNIIVNSEIRILQMQLAEKDERIKSLEANNLNENSNNVRLESKLDITKSAESEPTNPIISPSEADYLRIIEQKEEMIRVHVLQLESLQADLSETMSVNSVLRNQRDTWTDVHSSLQQQLSDSHRLLHAQKEEISRLCSELADVKNSLVKLNSENDDLL